MSPSLINFSITCGQMWSVKVIAYVSISSCCDKLNFNCDIRTGKNNPGINSLFKVSSLRYQFPENFARFREREINGGMH